MFLLSTFQNDVQEIKEMDATELVGNLQNNNVESLNMDGIEARGKLNDGTQYITILPEEMRYTFYSDYLKDAVEKDTINYSSEPPAKPSLFVSALPTILMLMVFGVFL